MDWHIREIMPNDKENFLAFLSNWITHIPVGQRYEWIYQNNPHGKAVTLLAIDHQSDEIIGCTSLFPRKVWVNGRELTGCIGGDTFVDPRFRRQGIAKQLHFASIKEMAEKGIQFHYGFPTPNNFKAFLKVGAFHPGNLKGLRLFLGCEPFLDKLNVHIKDNKFLFSIFNSPFELFKKFRYRSVNVKGLKTIDQFDKRFENLHEEIYKSHGVCCIRDIAYLTWRYFQNPHNEYTILGYEEANELQGFAAIKLKGWKCTIFDFFVKNQKDIAEKFIQSIIGYAISQNSSLITAMFNPRGPYMKFFLDCGFRFGLKTTVYPLMLLAGKDSKDTAFMKKIDNWYLTFGDQDIE